MDIRTGKAFGTSDEFFSNLEREWLRQSGETKDQGTA
jgi:hypothetical protein